MATANTAIKITSLPNIGNNIAPSTLIPVVNMAGDPVTQKANLQITGNLILAGAGTANFVPAGLANLAYSVVNAAQPNITSTGTLNVNTLKVSGGVNGQYLQTDGTGNLAWVSGSSSGNGEVGGSNTQIQFNDAGNFGGNTGFTFVKTTGILAAPFADVSGVANIVGGGATVATKSVLNVASTFGSNSSAEPASAQAIRGRVTGANLTKTRNYVTGVTGQYLVTGTNASEFIKAGILGVVGDQTTTADGAVVAYLDGDGGLTTANAAYAVSMKNSTPNSGFNYGLDLQFINLNVAGTTTTFKQADIRFNNGVTLVANTANNISINANVTAGNVLTSAQVIANGVIESGTGLTTGGYLSVDGNTDLHNTVVTGNLSATGNITATNLGNIASINLTGSNSNVLYGNGVFAVVAGGGANTGNVTFNDINIIGTGNLKLQPDSANASAYLDIFLTAGPDIHIAGNGETVILGTDDYANVAVNVNGNVSIQANAGTPQTWNFGTDGTTTFPTGNITSNTSLQFTTTFANVKTVEYQTAGVWDLYVEDTTTGPNDAWSWINVTFKDNLIDKPEVFIENQKANDGIAQRWTFDENGNLNFPRDVAGNTDPYLSIEGGAIPKIQSTDVSLGGPANLAISADYLNLSGSTGNRIILQADAGAIATDAAMVLSTNLADPGNIVSWTLDTTGNLYLPDTTSVLANVSITLEANDTGNITGLNLIGDYHANLYAHGNVTIVSDNSNTNATWTFGADGTTTFPTANVDLHNGGVQPGEVLQFGNPNLQSIITGPTPSANVNAERLIIQGQRGNGTGEGGDVYVWGGDADTNGGDIKIYAGDADNVSTGSGGYVNLAGGDGFDNGGAIDITGGSSANGTGGAVYIDAGTGELDGGTVTIQAGYGVTGQGGTVQITGGASGNGTGSYGNVVLGSGSIQWIFDNTGNLVLPANTFAVNYANGTQVSIGGGGNTGNVTFDDNIIMGTGDEFGSAGLYLAPGNASIANSAVQYLRVRGGDAPTHIHLDTGNNQFYDQYFGDDTKYVKLELGDAGNVVVGTDDDNGNLYSWSFTSDGNLILANGNGVIQSIANSSLDILNPNVSTMVLTPDPGYGSQALVLDPTTTGHIHLRAPGANIDEPSANLFLGGEASSFEVGYYNGSAPNVFVHSGGNTWMFDIDGNITFPRDGSNISTDPYLKILGGPSPQILSEDASLAGPANLAIVTDYLNLSGSNGNRIAIYADNGEIGTEANMLLYTNLANPGNIVSWKLDTTGNLTLPGNLVIAGNANVFGIDASLIQQTDGLPIVISSSGANGAVATYWVEDYANASTSNLAAVYVRPTVGANIVRIAVGQNGSPGPNLWDFNANGILSVPGNINSSGDSSAAPSLNDFFSVTSAANFAIVTDNANTDKTWNFDSTGNLTLPDTTSVIANVSITLEANDTGNITGLSLIGDYHANLYAHGNVTIVSDSSNTNATWAFGTDGDLTLPQLTTISDESVIGTTLTVGVPPTVIVISGADFSPVNTTYTKTSAATPTWEPAGYNPATDPYIEFSGGEYGIFNPGFVQALYVNTGTLNKPLTQWSVNPPLGSIAPTAVYTYGASGPDWVFGADGSLTVPGSIINDTSIVLSAPAIFNICTIATAGSGYNTGSSLKATTGGSGTGMTVGIGYGLSNQLTSVSVVNPGTGYVNGDVITVSEGTGGTFVITKYNVLANQTNNNTVQTDLIFANNTLTIPVDGNLVGNLIVPGSIVGSGASPAPYISGFSSVSALQFKNGNSNVTVNANSNLWTFDSTGNLTLPANAFAINYANGTQVSLGGGNVTWAQIEDKDGNSGPTIIALGQNAGFAGQGNAAIAIGKNAGAGGQGASSITIGEDAGGNITQGANSVAIGRSAGFDGQGIGAVAIGSGAGSNTQGNQSVAIGENAGVIQGSTAVAIGQNAGGGVALQGDDAVAIGHGAGENTQGTQSVAIGLYAGQTTQGVNAIAIGANAGITSQGNNSIILNATGANLNQTTANTFTVSPVRNDTSNIAEVMFYNATSKEVTYGNTISVAGNISGAYILGNGGTLSNVATQTTGSWSLAAGTNTVNLSVPINGTYSIWVRGNIPNGIVTYTATVVVTNTNVPVLGSSYGWYYAAGNALVLTAIPTQIVGTVNNISNAVVSTTTANVFTFGITNNSGNTAVVDYGYTKL